MSQPNPQYKAEQDREPVIPLADFKRAFIDAVSRADESAADYLLDHFAVDDYTARRISWE